MRDRLKTVPLNMDLSLLNTKRAKLWNGLTNELKSTVSLKDFKIIKC